MEKNTPVTRTISVGAVCNRTKNADLLAGRRHSSAGICALFWTTSGAQSLRDSFGSEFHTSRDNIFTNILTPDSIPQFTIPSLSVHTGLRSSETVKGTEKEENDAEDDERLQGPEPELALSLSVSLSSSTNSSYKSPTVLSSTPPDRKAQRSISDPFTRRRASLLRESSFPGSYTEAQHCLDPASKAALSLPHLAKVTTSYGFITLSQSPQMASEEALLCQARVRRLNKEQNVAYFQSKAQLTRTQAINVNSDSSHQSLAKQRVSNASTNSQAEGRRLSKGETQNSIPFSSKPKQSTNSKPKCRLSQLIRKHFAFHH